MNELNNDFRFFILYKLHEELLRFIELYAPVPCPRRPPDPQGRRVLKKSPRLDHSGMKNVHFTKFQQIGDGRAVGQFSPRFIPASSRCSPAYSRRGPRVNTACSLRCRHTPVCSRYTGMYREYRGESGQYITPSVSRLNPGVAGVLPAHSRRPRSIYGVDPIDPGLHRHYLSSRRVQACRELSKKYQTCLIFLKMLPECHGRSQAFPGARRVPGVCPGPSRRHAGVRLATPGPTWDWALSNLVIQPEKPNLNRQEMSALKQLQNNKNIIIKKSDKGSAVVIMNKQNYITEGMRQLNNPVHYKEISAPMFEETSDKVFKILQTLNNSGYQAKEEVQFLNPPEL